MLYYNRNVTFTRSRLIQVAQSKQGEIEGGKFTRIDATLVNVATSLFDVNLFDVHFSNPNDSRVTVIKADVLSGACFSLFVATELRNEKKERWFRGGGANWRGSNRMGLKEWCKIYEHDAMSKLRYVKTTKWVPRWNLSFLLLFSF